MNLTPTQSTTRAIGTELEDAGCPVESFVVTARSNRPYNASRSQRRSFRYRPNPRTALFRNRRLPGQPRRPRQLTWLRSSC